MAETPVQVLIIGGGIVGLSASLFLSHHSIPSLLIERHPSTSIHPRARGVNARTMELYRTLGIDSAIRSAGVSLAPSMGIYQGSSLASVIEPQKRSNGEPGAARKFPFAQYFQHLSPTEGARGTQDMIEPVLLAAALEKGGECRFNVECIALKQDESCVRVATRDRETGFESIVYAKYVIAADGAGSFTRQNLNVGTTGAGALGHLLNILFEADLRELVRGREFSMCLINQPSVHGLFTSINNSNRWVFHLSYSPLKGEKISDFPPERCKELIQLVLGMPEVEVEIKSILPWEPTVRVAEKFQHGRIFLAGDAAHTMPPWGGQGANSGIADVHNLAWKLALVLHKVAPTTLLTTYDEERLPVGRLVAEESGAAADERGLFAMWNFVLLVLGLVRRMPRLAGYGYGYCSKGIVREDETPWFWRQRWLLQPVMWICSLSAAAGNRAPHLWVRHSGKEISTLDLFGRGFVLLAGEDGNAWREAAEKVKSDVDVELVTYCVGPAADLVCEKGKWESVAGISASGALLVRPDGFIAWRAYEKPVDVHQKLEKVLLQALCR